jgi:alkanesulfonate monooxygenase
VHIYTVTPESFGEHDECGENFRARIMTAARASEQAGWSGMLVPHNLHDVDPWMVTCYLGSVTGTLVPLLALQPACTPPHTAAAAAAAYALLYGRPLFFNLVAGARDDEMRRIGDSLTHDERYERLRQYGRILRALLNGETVDEATGHYTYRRFRLEPRPDVLAQCKIFVAGSSPASMSVAAEIADVVVTHPVPYQEWREKFLDPLRTAGYAGDIGIRIGIVGRPAAADAWDIAMNRFPESWTGRQETLLKTRSQNVWSRELAQRATAGPGEPQPAPGTQDPYWLGAFRSGLASAPFLVGSYTDVADRLGEYTAAGVGHILLNGSYDDDFEHIGRIVGHTALSC